MSVATLVRLFKNYKGFKFCGVVHEQPEVKFPIYDLGLTLLHYGYVITNKELKKIKFERNAK